MHGANLDQAKEKLFKFLSGWLGGPDLFIQEYGHPRLRMRHFPFEIGIEERDQWVLFPSELKNAISGFSVCARPWMICQ